MKYLLYFFFLMGFLACDNELDVVEDFKDIPVVYGFISLSDTAQYIRVERAFISPDVSALELSKNVDSLYYLNATVSLLHVSTGVNYPLQMVDGNLEGYVREDGAFAQTPNYLYKIKSSDISLKAKDEYRLIIDRGDGSELITMSTKMVGPSDLRNPNVNTGSPLAFSSLNLTSMTWLIDPAAVVHNLSFIFNYRERNESTNGLFVKKSVTWKALRNIKSDDDRVSIELEGLNFFTFLRGAIPIDNTTERRFEDVTIVIESGGKEIKEFFDISSANLGITSTQDPPFFSNVPGGRGVFSSTNMLVLPKVTLTNQTLDSLREGSITKVLNFTN